MHQEKIHSLSPQELQFFTEAQDYLQAHPELMTELSTQGIFALLLEKGLEARQNGNYGIAACVVVRDQGQEIIVFGQNSLISEENPHGHAEMNAMKDSHILIQNPDQLRSFIQAGKAIYRKNPAATTPEKIIYTTLEPCPMCTVGSAVNGGINRVVIGEPDELAGALSPERLSNLAPLWKQIAEGQGLEVEFCQNEDSVGEYYVPIELQRHLSVLFFQTREKLDQHLSEHGFIDLFKLIAIARLQIDLDE